MEATISHLKFSLIKLRVNKGFTLLELLVTVAIAAIVLSIGIPSFSTIIKDNRQTTLLNEFTSYFHFAKNIAVTQGTSVTLCPENTAGTNCDNTAEWKDGWIVFVDKNQDGDVDDNGDTALCETDEDCVLKSYGAINNGISISASSTVVKISQKGFTSASTFTFCDSDSNSFKTKVLSKTGRWSSSNTHLSC